MWGVKGSRHSPRGRAKARARLCDPPSLFGSLSWCIILQCLEQEELRVNHGVSQLELCRWQNRNRLHLT